MYTLVSLSNRSEGKDVPAEVCQFLKVALGSKCVAHTVRRSDSCATLPLDD